jgi:2-(1,2-epoxy-1,2-dihydrophenyl)acetyl-CoA isomerase
MSTRTTTQSVFVEIAEHIGTITLNRPEKLNALNLEMVEELTEAMKMLSASRNVRVIVLTGAGRAFCAGADIGLLQRIVADNDEEAGRRLVDGGRAVLTTIRHAHQPVLASLNGVAAGGGANLALACDLRIAADDAKIGQVFARLGLHPDWGGTYFLPRLVGPAKALELFLSAEMVVAERAREMGMINRVVRADELAEATRAWAQRLAAAPPAAVQRAKRAVFQSEWSGLKEMLDYELKAQMACFRTADFMEGLKAYTENRDPHFTGF